MMRVALARAVATAFWIVTSVYALLSAIPFASKHFLEPGLMPALNVFAAWHAVLSLSGTAVVAALLAPWLRARHRAAVVLVATWAASAVLELLTPGLAALEPSWTAVAVSAAALIPPVWLSQIDLRGDADMPVAQEPAVAIDFAACLFAGLVVSMAHAVPSLVGAAAPQAAGAIARSIVLHLVAFAAIFAILSVIRALSRMSARPAALERWLTRAALAVAFGLFVDRIVLSPLSFTGARSAFMATALGAALAMLVGPRGTSAPDGVPAATGGLVPAWASRSAGRAVSWIAVAMLAIAAGERAIAGSDWNFAVGKTLAFASWLIVLAAALRVAPSIRSAGVGGSIASPIASIVPFVACLLLVGVQQLGARGEKGDPAQARPVVADASTRFILDALAAGALVDRGLYEYLQRNTNIARSVAVAPVNVELAPLAGASAWRPHIFLFVVDSLRRDYLSPYNSAVTFTPAIGRFAAGSTVFERGFTRYGATGLAVPSIWTGSMLLHKQYVTPFAPMNSLSKLLHAEAYTEWMSVDPILDVIAPAGTRRESLDAATSVKDYRLCSTLDEVRSRLGRLTAAGAPAFVYSLPQDIHVSSIAREGSRPVDQGRYDGFNAAYASRVRRFDDCFGRFLDDLEARGLYDDSLVILTSDHGDSLGEEGRMGHAYTIFPEIVQVPLIVHLPARLRAGYTADTKAPAFTSDITPSIYRLLDHEPRLPASFFGQPLFHRVGSPAPARQPAEVIASSYGSVYGALLDDAARLYIIDGVSLREYEYELDGSGAGRAVAVRPQDRAAGQQAIRATVSGIARFFNYPAGIQ
jgi:hypothetical protein